MAVLEEQILGLLAMSLTGFLGAAAYDLYRALRHALHLGKRGTFIGDIVYALLFLACFLCFLLPVNEGELRSYVYLGLFLGYLGYFALLHRFLWRPLLAVVGAICRILGGLGRIVSLPFRLIGAVLLWPWRKLRALLGRARQAWRAKEKNSAMPEDSWE